MLEEYVLRGIEIKRLRKELQLSQQELAERLHVSRQFVSQLELGKKVVPKKFEEQLKEEFHLMGGQASVEAKIDFLRVRFKTQDIESVVNKVLHMEMDWFVHDNRGFYRYTETFSYGSIRLFRNRENMDMGIMLDLSGQGCRELESIFEEDGNRSWTEFFWSLYEDDIFGEGVVVDTKVTRIDIALDELLDEEKENFDLYELKDKMEQGLVDSSFKNFDYRGGLVFENGQQINKGLSLYFGSRQSPLHFCFYQKDFDLARKENVSVEDARIKYGIKNRYEIRLADEKAFLFIEYFLSTGESLDWLVKELINGSLVVYEWKNGNRVFCKAWYNVVDKMEGLRLSVKAEKPSIDKTLRWLSSYLAPSLKMVKVIDNLLGTDELSERIESAELKEKHLEMIETVCTDIQDILVSNIEGETIREYLASQFGLSKEMDAIEDEYPF